MADILSSATGGFLKGLTAGLNRDTQMKIAAEQEARKQAALYAMEDYKNQLELSRQKEMARVTAPGRTIIDSATGQVISSSPAGEFGREDVSVLNRGGSGGQSRRILSPEMLKQFAAAADLDANFMQTIPQDWAAQVNAYRMEGGKSVISKENLKVINTTKAGMSEAIGMLKTFDKLIDPLFTSDTLAEQYMEGAVNFAGEKFKTNKSAVVYAGMKKAFSGRLVKTLGGDAGMLSNFDVERIMQSLPAYGENRETAKSKIAEAISLAKSIIDFKLQKLSEGIPMDQVKAMKLGEYSKYEERKSSESPTSTATQQQSYPSNAIDRGRKKVQEMEMRMKARKKK